MRRRSVLLGAAAGAAAPIVLGASAASAATSTTANPAFTYTIIKTTPGGVPTYTALNSDGSTAATSSDSTSPLRSGLRAVLIAVAASNVSIYFHAGVYSFPEDPAGSEDHWAPNGIDGLTVSGDSSRSTILSNWRDDSQTGYDTVPDVEPFSFTRCHDLTYRNFRVWAGGNRDANNSSDALDFDGCRGTHVENIIVERSRARGIVFDGGDTGAVSQSGRIIGCEVRGVALAPSVKSGPTGTLAAQEYRYVITYVDSIFGETPPSEASTFKATGAAKATLLVLTGPAYSATKGVTNRKVYRWSTAQPTYRLLTTLDNTVTSYDDDASDASIAGNATVPLTGTPLVPMEGIKLLGSNRHLVSDNEIIGVGGHGIQMVRKGTDAATNQNSNGHRIIGNTVRRAGAGTTQAARVGVYLGGASFNVVQGNSISDCGAVAAMGYAVQVQGLTGAVTEYNTIGPNTLFDDQDAGSPSGGATTKYGVSISGSATPDNNVLVPSAIRGMVTAAVSNAGTNTRQYASI